MNKKKIRPCPICYADGFVIDYKLLENGNPYYYVVCTQYGCPLSEQSSYNHRHFVSRHAAISRWNDFFDETELRRERLFSKKIDFRVAKRVSDAEYIHHNAVEWHRQDACARLGYRVMTFLTANAKGLAQVRLSEEYIVIHEQQEEEYIFSAYVDYVPRE